MTSSWFLENIINRLSFARFEKVSICELLNLASHTMLLSIDYNMIISLIHLVIYSDVANYGNWDGGY